MNRARAASLEAPAKINLFLRVLHKRADGYSELETLFQMVRLADEVRVAFHPAGPAGRVTLEVEGPDLGPADQNLAVRAGRSFLAASGAEGSVDVRLTKRIPAGAGLGGGSSDAAAVLRLLQDITSHVSGRASSGGRALTSTELHRVAGELGSDVPFFLSGSTLALGRGRGELLSTLPSLPPVPIVLALPPVHVSTAEAYAGLGEARRQKQPIGARPDEVVADLDWVRVAMLAENDFEAIAAPRHPEVARSLEGLRDAGARFALLSGSGGASFGVFGSMDEATGAATRLEADLGWPFVVTETGEHPPLVKRG